MKTEFELRFYPFSAESIGLYLDKKLGAQGVPELLARVIYDIDSNQRKWLRVRTEGNSVTCTVKQIFDSGSVDGTQEIEIVLQNGDYREYIKFFDAVGLKKLSYQETIRTTYTYDSCLITIDQWPGLEAIVEIEGPSKEQVLAAKEYLGFGEAFLGDIVKIYQCVYGLTLQEFNAIQELTFNNYMDVLPKK